MSNHKTIPMKKLLTTLCFLPLTVAAQDAVQIDAVKPTSYKNEIGIGTGISMDLKSEPLTSLTGARIQTNYLRNYDRVQIGLAVEAGIDNGYRYVSPTLIFNQCFPIGKSYAYFGSAVGYYYEQFVGFGWNSDYDANGYSLGLQAGYAWNFSKHFSFTSEIALRSAQIWFENSEFISIDPPYTLEPDGYIIRYTDIRFQLYLPIVFGMRYRF
jgi:hypothetical protein